MKNKLRRSIAATLAASMLVASLLQQTFAGPIATEALTYVAERERLAAALSRADVRARLEVLGVSPADVQARVDALSDKEAAELAAQLETLPAGGDGIVGAIVLVFLVLLLTDIVGLTKVFPFTRSIK